MRRLNIVLFFLTLVALVVHIESLVRFNRREISIHGNDSEAPVRMEIDARADSTSSWLKRGFLMDDNRRVDLTGQTIDGTMINRSRDTVQDWQLRINILGDCYINQAWNGEVEIHQFTGTEKEKVQRLNLQNYRLEDVTFEHRYDGDLLIPLQQGDYVLYFPSTRFSEMPINGGDEVKIGVIFYYLDELNLSDYDLQVHFHRSFTQGVTFYAFVALAILWMLSMVMSVTSMLAYRRAIKEMELRKSGIFSMSDIYDLISCLISDNQKAMNRGYVAIGLNGWFLSANEKCFDFLPDLKTQRADTSLSEDCPSGKILLGIIDSYNSNGTASATFRSGERTFAYEIAPFRYRNGGTPQGYLIDIRDATEETRSMEILADFNNRLNQEVAEKTRSVENMQEKLVLSLADMVENRDSNTGGHIKRTSDVVRILVEDIRKNRYFSLSDDLAKDLVRTAPMHDPGKVSIDSSILNKPGRLTSEEYAIMKTHSTISGQMVRILLEGMGTQFDPNLYLVFLSCRSELEHYYSLI